MEATSAPPILLPGIDHLPCLQEIRSVKDKPFYCQSSVATTFEPYGHGLPVYKLSQKMATDVDGGVDDDDIDDGDADYNYDDNDADDYDDDDGDDDDNDERAAPYH